jgi:hypothetical protein
MKLIAPDIINDILEALDRRIGVHGGVPSGLVVCGGTALSALVLKVMRTTRDMDVLGSVSGTENGVTIQSIKKFPEWLVEAADRVAGFDLPERWLNLGPASQVESGLQRDLRRDCKEGLWQYLTIYFISRIDQIHFKLYASVDQDGYHVQDLFALKPTENEMEEAAKWVVTQDVLEVFRALLKDFLGET